MIALGYTAHGAGAPARCHIQAETWYGLVTTSPDQGATAHARLALQARCADALAVFVPIAARERCAVPTARDWAERNKPELQRDLTNLAGKAQITLRAQDTHTPQRPTERWLRARSAQMRAAHARQIAAKAALVECAQAIEVTRVRSRESDRSARRGYACAARRHPIRAEPAALRPA